MRLRGGKEKRRGERRPFCKQASEDEERRGRRLVVFFRRLLVLGKINNWERVCVCVYLSWYIYNTSAVEHFLALECQQKTFGNLFGMRWKLLGSFCSGKKSF